MNKYRVHYKDYYGVCNHIYISANSEAEAKKIFEYGYGDCKFLYIS